MKKVEPIRDKDKIEEMKTELLKQSYRNYMLFVIGINTGLRIGDILELKVEDVRNETHIEIKEQKTGKTKTFLINSKLKSDLDKYIKNMNDWEYLFQSQKGDNKPISRVQAYRVLKKGADKVGLKKIGTHSLRKTFGYHHYKLHKDVALLQDLFNHSAPSITLDYIGINQDIMDKTIENFYL
ncbi:site-specific integrase [Fuchsiella alkaliacetigena]|uniref:site-specific integrase n=1 Tax=Fuchsiella alkaliacetigena TaxID=957042 RepID=UPI00200ADD4D|nr:site-specific integrase [Fuchsiella alkaliacetigena]MCK8825261.1 site-specific integrase [Fuchsiella alkaliacetigena]